VVRSVQSVKPSGDVCFIWLFCDVFIMLFIVCLLGYKCYSCQCINKQFIQ